VIEHLFCLKNKHLTHLSRLATNKTQPGISNEKGILLYPILNPILRLDVELHDHRIRVESIDFNQG